MELGMLRRMVAVAIALLLVHQVGTWIAAFFGGFWGGLAAIAVAAISLLGVRLASRGAGGVAWFLVPSIAFAVVPLVAKVWAALRDKSATWVDHLIAVAPLLIGFVVPVGLLLIVYMGLRRRSLAVAPGLEREP
jgi:hypothetical protein